MGKTLVGKVQYSAWLIARMLFSGCILFVPVAYASELAAIELTDTCPPSFRLSDDNRCSLRHMYQLYDSLQDSGIGGLKTALP
ncbi:MAG: cytochrome c peroxidase, partial [Porticoccaceae bacterium]